MLDAGHLSNDEIAYKMGCLTILVVDQTLINAAHASQVKAKITPEIYIHRIKSDNFYKKLFYQIFDSNLDIVFWASLNDMHALLSHDLMKLEDLGISVDSFLDRIIGVIWPSSPRSTTNSMEVDYRYIDPWMIKSENPINSRYRILSKCRFEIEIIHSVDVAETYTGYSKIWDIDIPGIIYKTRQVARLSLAGSNIRIASKSANRMAQKLNGALWRAGIRYPPLLMHNNYIGMRFSMSRSEASFVCGSGYRYFVRKFLEAPIFGSVIIGYVPKNFSDYGFIDSINYLDTIPEKLNEKVEALISDKDLSLALKTAALNLVVEKHSTQARAENLISALKIAETGAKFRAFFLNGEFRILQE